MSKSHPVKLYIYDLSKGLAALFSPQLLQKKVDGIWHTSIVVYGEEFYFGDGVNRCPPGSTHLGPPLKEEYLGVTEIPKEVFEDYLDELSKGAFGKETYELISHNCNHFSEELSQFLVGKSIPKYILDLPSEILGTQWGQSLLPLISSLGPTSIGQPRGS